jgi:hypothetical protein
VGGLQAAIPRPPMSAWCQQWTFRGVRVVSALPMNLLQNYFAPLREEQFSKSSLEQEILIHETVV